MMFSGAKYKLRRVVNKAEKLEGMSFAHDPNIVLLTVTWLRDDIFDSEFEQKNYKVFRKDRDGREGGIAIICNNKTQVLKMPDVQSAESIFCKVYTGRCRYIIGAVYRPPNSSIGFIERINNYLHCYVKGQHKLIIGDFNLPNMNWSTFSLRLCQATDTEISDIMFKYGLTKIVTDPTRTEHGSKPIEEVYLVSDNINENHVVQRHKWRIGSQGGDAVTKGSYIGMAEDDETVSQFF